MQMYNTSKQNIKRITFFIFRPCLSISGALAARHPLSLYFSFPVYIIRTKTLLSTDKSNAVIPVKEIPAFGQIKKL